jgi:heme/copper-type cytochrome/quinol oxidase subunit 2
LLQFYKKKKKKGNYFLFFSYEICGRDHFNQAMDQLIKVSSKEEFEIFFDKFCRTNGQVRIMPVIANHQ